MGAAFLDDFRQTVDRAAERLLRYSDDEAGQRSAPDKWSRKEIIGHLIDSASNNHGRFVRGQLQDALECNHVVARLSRQTSQMAITNLPSHFDGWDMTQSHRASTRQKTIFSALRPGNPIQCLASR